MACMMKLLCAEQIKSVTSHFKHSPNVKIALWEVYTNENIHGLLTLNLSFQRPVVNACNLLSQSDSS